MKKTAGRLILCFLCALVLVACGGAGDGTDDVVDGTDAAVCGAPEGGQVPETITDEATGLIWQARPPEDWVLWDAANVYCDGLELAGYSDWRLPTIDELRTLIRGCPGTVTGGACQVAGGCADACYTDDCAGCGVFQGPGCGGCYMDEKWGDSCAYHWSASTYVGGSVFSPTTLAWYVEFDIGWVWSGNINDNHMVARCVRQ